MEEGGGVGFLDGGGFYSLVWSIYVGGVHGKANFCMRIRGLRDVWFYWLCVSGSVISNQVLTYLQDLQCARDFD